MSFEDWLISLGIMSSRSIHVKAPVILRRRNIKAVEIGGWPKSSFGFVHRCYGKPRQTLGQLSKIDQRGNAYSVIYVVGNCEP